MNAKEAIVTLPVYKKKEVPITVDFLNMPTGFNLDSLNYSIDPTTMEIAGPVEIVDYINEISLGSIDMKELTPDSEVYYSAILPDGVISIDNVNDALVSFSSVDYDSKSFKVSDIRLVNAPKEYEICPLYLWYS